MATGPQTVLNMILGVLNFFYRIILSNSRTILGITFTVGAMLLYFVFYPHISSLLVEKDNALKRVTERQQKTVGRAGGDGDATGDLQEELDKHIGEIECMNKEKKALKEEQHAKKAALLKERGKDPDKPFSGHYQCMVQEEAGLNARVPSCSDQGSDTTFRKAKHKVMHESGNRDFMTHGFDAGDVSSHADRVLSNAPNMQSSEEPTKAVETESHRKQMRNQQDAEYEESLVKDLLAKARKEAEERQLSLRKQQELLKTEENKRVEKIASEEQQREEQEALELLKDEPGVSSPFNTVLLLGAC